MPVNRPEKGVAMSANIYVGNISFRAYEDDLENIFSEHGEVESVKIITDRDTNRSKGFGFVVMKEEEAAKSAISALNGADLQGRNLVVNEAREKRN